MPHITLPDQNPALLSGLLFRKSWFVLLQAAFLVKLFWMRLEFYDFTLYKVENVSEFWVLSGIIKSDLKKSSNITFY